MSRVILLGIAEDLANELTGVLTAESHQVTRGFHDARPEVAFLSGDTPDFMHHLSSLRQEEPHLPVVVVTRLPEATRWLDALEAGARDYCGAPFERVQVRWIMETVCPQVRAQTA